MALMTASALRDAIPELTGTTEDTKLETLIARIDAAFARYCGIPPATAIASPTLESASYTLYLTGSGGRSLDLPLRPVTAIGSIYDDPTEDFTDSTYLVASGDYAIRYDRIRGQYVQLTSTATHGAWSTGARWIRVACTAGYSSGAAPTDLLEAVRIAGRIWWRARKNAGMNTSGGNASASYVEIEDRRFLNDEIKQILGPFRLPSAMIGGSLG